MIQKTYQKFFNKHGFVLDNAYEPYFLNRFIEFYRANDIEYIFCQDDDLLNLAAFSDLRYVTVSPVAIHFKALSELKDLRGLEICSHQLSLISSCVANQIESAVLHWASGFVTDLTLFPRLTCLQIGGYPGFRNVNLTFCSNLKLKRLAIMSRYISTLSGIETIETLESFEATQCSKLQNISAIKQLKNLKSLCFSECNHLQDNFTENIPKSLESLTILGSEYSGPKTTFRSIDFLYQLPKLKEFKTNWRIKEYDLPIIEHLKNTNVHLEII